MPGSRPNAAPAGFWRENRSEEMLMSVVLAYIGPAEIQGLNIAKIANVVGEGKLSEKSCKAKLTQLIEKGRQRIADYEARQRAGDDHAPQMIANNPPALPAANRAEANETQVQPRARPNPVPEADNTETPAGDVVRRKRKKDTSGLAEKSKSPSKKKKKKKHETDRRAADQTTNKTPAVAQVTSGVQNEPARPVSSRAAEAEVNTQSSSRAPAREATAGGPARLKQEPEPEPQPQVGNPELLALGRTKSSAINVDELDSDAEFNEPASPPSYLYKTVTKPTTGSSDSLLANGVPRSALQPITNGATPNPSTIQTVAKVKVRKPKNRPSGKLHKRPVLTKTRDWQAPYIRETSVSRSDIARYDRMWNLPR